MFAQLRHHTLRRQRDLIEPDAGRVVQRRAIAGASGMNGISAMPRAPQGPLGSAIFEDDRFDFCGISQIVGIR